jgi:hypothetical protein
MTKDLLAKNKKGKCKKKCKHMKKAGKRPRRNHHHHQIEETALTAEGEDPSLVVRQPTTRPSLGKWRHTSLHLPIFLHLSICTGCMVFLN